MTDNEKRAHDLAVAMVPVLYNQQVSSVNIEDIESGITVDVYKDYMEVYELALKSFNRDFPDGK